MFKKKSPLDHRRLTSPSCCCISIHPKIMLLWLHESTVNSSALLGTRCQKERSRISLHLLFIKGNFILLIKDYGFPNAITGNSVLSTKTVHTCFVKSVFHGAHQQGVQVQFKCTRWSNISCSVDLNVPRCRRTILV